MSFSMKRRWERSNHCTNLRGLYASHYLQSHRCIGAALFRTANLMSFCLNITTRGPRQVYCLACRFVGKHVVFHIDVQGGRSRGKETCKNLVSKQSSFDIVGHFQTKQFWCSTSQPVVHRIDAKHVCNKFSQSWVGKLCVCQPWSNTRSYISRYGSDRFGSLDFLARLGSLDVRGVRRGNESLSCLLRNIK